MGDPPLEIGNAQFTVSVSLTRIAVVACGALGALGVVAVTAALDELSPAALVALTLTE
jgi:hypothetical protein